MTSLQVTPNRLRALDEHARLTDEIADLFIARGQTSSMAVTVRAQTFESMQSQGVAITAAREAAQSSTARWDAEVADLTGRIEALRARLRHLELVLEA